MHNSDTNPSVENIMKRDLYGRLLIFIVAYNAEKTIESVLKRIPSSLLKIYDIEILVIDDSSQDETFRKSKLLSRTGVIPFKLTVLYNPKNQGYGGNQKIGFHYAIEHSFDWVALVHGDGQYAPECLPELIDILAKDKADVVFGSRMLEKKAALKGGMPYYKYVGNKILTTYQNMMLGSELSEFHSGYRLYSIEALKKIPFQLNSNDFHFDTEIIIQLLFAEQRIDELAIPTFYGDEICHVNGIKYGLDVIKSTFLAKIQPAHIFYDPKYDCKPTTNEYRGNVSEEHYLNTLLSQPISPKSNILLVGNVPDKFMEKLKADGHTINVVTSIYFRENISPKQAYDYLYLLEDSGISQNPEEMIAKLVKVSSSSPEMKICVTVANIGFIITRILLFFGRFAYTRRGIINLNSFHFFTLRSAKKIFKQNGFSISDVKGLPTPYSALFSSLMLAKALTGIHSLLIKIRPSLFSFQFVLFVTSPTTLQHLLASAIEISEKKSDKIDPPS